MKYKVKCRESILGGKLYCDFEEKALEYRCVKWTAKHRASEQRLAIMQTDALHAHAQQDAWSPIPIPVAGSPSTSLSPLPV